MNALPRVSASHDCLAKPVHAVAFTTSLSLRMPVIRIVPHHLVAVETQVLGAVGFVKESESLVGFITEQPPRLPNRLTRIDPRIAHHSGDLVPVVWWARRKAETSPERVRNRIYKLAFQLEDTAREVLPNFLEEVTRIFAAARLSPKFTYDFPFAPVFPFILIIIFTPIFRPNDLYF
ncbi:MAG: hypothetical protein Q4D85_08685 [Corynebacterium sp.]|uniref:hypothetical protein n=1 Tax=Corynebacterium sp. TaxID=1720 RepID=UPI0026DA7DEA|nr:hypothetical protein [Corynebacterium sp.]MDO5098822.1 hypothetical protein [Corynebacterium sp.]